MSSVKFKKVSPNEFRLKHVRFFPFIFLFNFKAKCPLLPASLLLELVKNILLKKNCSKYFQIEWHQMKHKFTFFVLTQDLKPIYS